MAVEVALVAKTAEQRRSSESLRKTEQRGEEKRSQVHFQRWTEQSAGIMVRVAFCGISHETNTFATAALGLTGMAGDGKSGFRPSRGDAVLRGGGYTGGMVTAAKELGYECVGLLFGGTEPSGTIDDAAFEGMRDEIISRLRDAMPVDVVAIENHGAGVVRG